MGSCHPLGLWEAEMVTRGRLLLCAIGYTCVAVSGTRRLGQRRQGACVDRVHARRSCEVSDGSWQLKLRPQAEHGRSRWSSHRRGSSVLARAGLDGLDTGQWEGRRR